MNPKYFIQKREADRSWSREAQFPYSVLLEALEKCDSMNRSRPNDGRDWLEFRVVDDRGMIYQYTTIQVTAKATKAGGV